MTLYLELKTNAFSILGNCVIKHFCYSETYKLWHIHLPNGDDLFIHNENIIKLGISTDNFDGENYESIALVVNGFVKYINFTGEEKNED